MLMLVARAVLVVVQLTAARSAIIARQQLMAALLLPVVAQWEQTAQHSVPVFVLRELVALVVPVLVL